MDAAGRRKIEDLYRAADLGAAEGEIAERETLDVCNAAQTQCRFPHEAEPTLAEPVFDAQPRSLVGETIGDYCILSLLGRGGMGEVYLAADRISDRKVAIKLLRQDLTGDKLRVSRLAREARTASALSHPNIVSIYAFGESSHGLYIAMEWIDGRNLNAYAPAPFKPAAIAQIGLQVSEALCATHAAGLVHRDLKPDNIMVRRDGVVKILDFGLARLGRPVGDTDDTALTLPGIILGTPKYMSPEQARGDWLTTASDVFSLGIIFYELATAKHPFDAQSRLGYMHAIVSRQVIPPAKFNPGIPGWLEFALLRMLEKDPERRFTASDLVQVFGRTDSAAGRSELPARGPSCRMVGRRKERDELNSAFDTMEAGQSLVLAISGEAGQGKTTLIDDFLVELTTQNRGLIARGSCSERLVGAGAYLPVFEVLESLVHSPERELAVSLMKAVAPTWNANLTAQSNTGGSDTISSPHTLKREFTAFLEEISRQQPLLIFIDDVHWADYSTIDLLAYLVARLDRMRVLILVSFRPTDIRSGNHPYLQLQRELQTRGVCREMPLEFFSLEDIVELIELRFPGHGFPEDFAHKLLERTEGNPLFVSDLLRHLQERGSLRMQDGRWSLTGPAPELLKDMPDSVRSMVQRKIEQLSEEERELLMAASVQGADFDTAVLAQAVGADPVDLEDNLEKLERKSGLLRLMGEWELPDRTLTLGYRFVHGLYHDEFYGLLRPARRKLLSRAVAEALLHFHKTQSARIAAQLAALFEAAREFASAAANYQTASRNALRLVAGSEAETLARRGLECVKAMPDSPERARYELSLYTCLASALRDQRTHASSEAVESHRRVKELSQTIGDETAAFFAEVGLFWSSLSTCNFAAALDHAQKCLQAAESSADTTRIMQSRYLMGYASFHLARHEECDRNLRAALALYDPQSHAKLVEVFGLDIRANGMATLALNCWYRGFPDEADATMNRAIEFARAGGHPVALSVALVSQTYLYDFFDNPQGMLRVSEEVIAIAVKYGLEKNTLFWGTFGRGWALARLGQAEEGSTLMRSAMADAEAMQMSFALPGFAYALASVFMEHGQLEPAQDVLARYTPQAARSGPREKLAEMHRLHGDLLFVQGRLGPAERLLSFALETAQDCGQNSSALRVAMSLARLYRARGEIAAARNVVSDLYGRFREGFQTPDLKKAKAMIEASGA